MNKPSIDILKAIAELQNDPSFQVFYRWLNESFFSEAVASNKVPSEPQRTWAQGRVQQLEQLIDVIKNARESIEAVQRGGGQ